MAERKTARCYPLRLEQEADGGYVVTIPDIGYGAPQGDTLKKALHQAEDLLEEAILGMMANDEDVPSPSPARGRPAVGLPALTGYETGTGRLRHANRRQLRGQRVRHQNHRGLPSCSSCE